MPTYTYRARNREGRVVTGTITADAVPMALAQIRRRGLVALEVTPQRFVALKELLNSIPLVGGVGLGSLVLFSRQMSTLINAGIPIVQCLNILIEQTSKKNFKNIIANVRDDIERGEFISTSLAKHPRAFSQLFVSMIKSGETGGVLDEVLERLAEYYEKLIALRRKVLLATLYPAFIIIAAVIVIIVFLTFVIPQFNQVFSMFGGELPLPTQILLKVSAFMRKYFIFIMMGIIGVVALFFFIVNRFPKARYLFHIFLLRVPLLGPLFRKIAIERFSHTLGTLVRSGVPILESLEICAKSAGNMVIERAILQARSSIREGERISDPLRASKEFPPMVTQMITVGEETGALDAMLTKLADYYSKEVDAAVSAFASLIEPIFIFILGVIVGGMLISMYLPIFTLPSLMAAR